MPKTRPAYPAEVPPADGRSGPCRPDPTDLAREFEPARQTFRTGSLKLIAVKVGGRPSRRPPILA